MRLSIAFHVDSVEFTPAVIAGTASLGGSESACLGLARALAARGHRVCIFTTQLHKDAPATDHAGVQWYHSHEITEVSRFVDWDVFVALRLPQVFGANIKANYRILWNQDLMVGEAAKLQVMSTAWAYDEIHYVSGYHRKQWEGLVPELAPIGHVIKNGFDPALVPTDVVKHPNRIIHITRPERALRPLLAMWPALKARVPDAELHLCRYNSMYDATGWGRICAQYDELVAQVNAQVGGITYLGELGKADLYRAIAESAVMWYPGVVDFAETSCVAAIEAQACGTPFVGSAKGALPETAPYSILIEGDADSSEYQRQSIDAVERTLRGYRLVMGDQGVARDVVYGRAHVQSYTYDAIAAEWEAHILDRFAQRVDQHGPQIVARLLHEDNHVAAQALAREMGDAATAEWCQYVIDGKDQVATDYAERALDPRYEMHGNPRTAPVLDLLKGKRKILDLACGNGTFSLLLAEDNPDAHIVGVDYAQGNIDVATQAAAELGLSERVTFICAPAYDFTTHEPTEDIAAIGRAHGPFDGVFVGEFLEHIANVPAFLEAVHSVTVTGARVVTTMPSGPFGELAHRDIPVKKGHVHHFRPDDLAEVFGAQTGLDIAYLDGGMTPRGSEVGHWIVSYDTNGQPVGVLPTAKRCLVTRPKLSLSVGMIVNDTKDIRRCLSSIWQIADEVVLGDTGADPVELARVAEYFPRTRIVPVGAVHDLNGGFSEARNTVLRACTGDWFLWIDSDEELLHADRLWRYLEGGVFVGYGLKQNHLMVDTPNTFDTPIRLFQRLPSIEFYGCIHEQPQMGDCNGDIIPSLQLYDAEIAHIGYVNEDVRREKALRRNLPLLLRDREVFPDRKLGVLLILREALNLGTWAMEAAGGRMTPQAKQYFQQVIALFETHFADPANKYHALARPFYESVVSKVAGAIQVETAFTMQTGGVKQRPKPERFWVRTPDQLDVMLDAKRAEWLKPLQPPPQIDVAPLDVPVVEAAPV
jgi:2-polyprenyl-3-methyl-5-hydroxy-6-metoxy-1,4-benzoquinol methylase/glycosyltransferase involved in cell wall biosynthesis